MAGPSPLLALVASLLLLAAASLALVPRGGSAGCAPWRLQAGAGAAPLAPRRRSRALLGEAAATFGGDEVSRAALAVRPPRAGHRAFPRLENLVLTHTARWCCRWARSPAWLHWLQEDAATLDPHLTAIRAAHREAYGDGGGRNGPSYVDKTFGIQLVRDDNALMGRLLRPTRDAKDMPPASEFKLSSKLIKAHADANNVVMVTWANFHYLDFGAYREK